MKHCTQHGVNQVQRSSLSLWATCCGCPVQQGTVLPAFYLFFKPYLLLEACYSRVAAWTSLDQFVSGILWNLVADNNNWTAGSTRSERDGATCFQCNAYGYPLWRGQWVFSRWFLVDLFCTLNHSCNFSYHDSLSSGLKDVTARITQPVSLAWSQECLRDFQ